MTHLMTVGVGVTASVEGSTGLTGVTSLDMAEDYSSNTVPSIKVSLKNPPSGSKRKSANCFSNSKVIGAGPSRFFSMVMTTLLRADS